MIVVSLKIYLISLLFGHSYALKFFKFLRLVYILFVHNPQFGRTTGVYYAYRLFTIIITVVSYVHLPQKVVQEEHLEED